MLPAVAEVVEVVKGATLGARRQRLQLGIARQGDGPVAPFVRLAVVATVALELIEVAVSPAHYVLDKLMETVQIDLLGHHHPAPDQRVGVEQFDTQATIGHKYSPSGYLVAR